MMVIREGHERPCISPSRPTRGPGEVETRRGAGLGEPSLDHQCVATAYGKLRRRGWRPAEFPHGNPYCGLGRNLGRIEEITVGMG
jgi:hypothetical protein